MAIIETPNVKLKKPEISDVFDLDTHFNDNFDIIDSEFKKHADALDIVKGYGFGGTSKLLETGTDLNTITKQGLYEGIDLVNDPYTDNLGDQCFVEVFEKDSDNCFQRITYTSDISVWYRRKYNGVWYNWVRILDALSGIQSTSSSKELLQRYSSGTVGVNPGAETTVTFTYATPYLAAPDVVHSLYAEGAYNDVFSVVNSRTPTKASVKIKNDSATVKYFIVSFIAVGNV